MSSRRFGPTLYGLGAAMLVLAVAAPIINLSISVVLVSLLIYAGLAYSINFITGMTGYVSFGQVIFLGIGSYALGGSVSAYHVHPLVGVALGALLGLLFAIGIGLVTLRFRGVYFAISTLVIALAAYDIVLEVPQLGSGTGIILNIGFQPLMWFYTAWAIVLAEMLATYFINRGRVGFGIRAIRGEEDGAKSVGVNAPRLKLYVFMISGLFGGAAGAVFAWSVSGVFPETSFDLAFSLLMLAMVIIGGMGTSIGPLLGAIIVYLPYYYLFTVLPTGQPIIVGLLVIVVALFIPEGIVGILRKRSPRLRVMLE